MHKFNAIFFVISFLLSSDAFSGQLVTDLEISKIVAGPGEYPNIYFTTPLPDPDNRTAGGSSALF